MILEIKNLVKSYLGRLVLNKLSFSISPGEVVGLLGPNGAGKTTAFYIAIGLIKPDAGSIIFNGEDVTILPMHKRARMGMGYLAQEPSIFRHLSVEDNLMCILETKIKKRSQRREKLKSLLEELRLGHLAKKQAGTLSGGERRRLEISRALITNPSLLLLDEPFANVDPITVHEIKKMIQILKQKNISVLITDHNAREIITTVDRSYLIQGGQVTLSGSIQDMLSSDAARATYFGEEFKI